MIDSEPIALFSAKVSDPIKQGGTVGGYISYKITTNTTLEGFSHGESLVDRRYSDFVWLFDKLTSEFPAVVVPALPEKQTFGFAAMGFNKVAQIDSRKRGLEKFIERCGSHPQLVTSPALHSFLCDNDALFETNKKQASESTPKKDPMAWMGKKFNDLSAKKTELEKTATDDKFEEIDDYLIVLVDLMTKISKAATQLVKRDRQVAEASFLFSQALGDLGQTEDGSVGSGLIQFGSSIDQLSQSATKLGEQELMQFDEPLQEYVRVMQGLQKALKRRANLRNEFQDTLSDLEIKRSAFQRIENTNHPDESKKEQALENAQKHYDTTRDVYENVSQELLEEFRCFKANKSGEIRAILTKWMDLNLTYCVRAKQTWSELATTADGITPTNVDDRDFGTNPFGSGVPEVPVSVPPADNNPFGDTPTESAPPLPTYSHDTQPPPHSASAPDADGYTDEDLVGV